MEWCDLTPGVAYVGIDPGKKGAVAVIYNEGPLADSWHVPIKPGKKREYDLLGMLRLVHQFRQMKEAGWRILAGIERQSPRPTDPKNTAFKVGIAQAYWEMACAANRLPYVLVAPQSWKAKYVAKGAPKGESVVAAQAIYPDQEFPLVKDEARAEALLIADFMMRTERKLNFPKRRVA